MPVSRSLLLGGQGQGQVQDALEVRVRVEAGRDALPEHGQRAGAERVVDSLTEQLRLDGLHGGDDIRLVHALGNGLQHDELTDDVVGPKQHLDDRTDVLGR